MWEKFRRIISTYPDYRNRTYLLAVSGGPDSMVLLDLMRRTGLPVHVAHCNFKLRGQDSDDDMILVKNYCRKYGIPFHGRICPVDKTKNIQLEARRLRYDFFHELLRQIPADILMTAHHADDNIETFFINLLRGTGINGLTGITETDIIKRPLLHFTRQEIENYARRQKLPWREDRSNLSDDYTRNAIRHHLVPLLDTFRPDARKQIGKTMRLLRLTADVENEWFERMKQQTLEQGTGEEIFHFSRFPDKKKLPLFLHKWTYPKGFRDLETILALTQSQAGKKTESPDYVLIRHGDTLILTPKTETKASVRWDEWPEKTNEPVALESVFMEKPETDEIYRHNPSPQIIFVDAEKFRPPFEIRPWRPGERMQPLGMKGSKKISDILTDMKVPLHRKQRAYLLLSDNRPVWLIGYRQDERFKITPDTRRVLKIVYHPSDTEE